MANNKTAQELATEIVGKTWNEAKDLAYDTPCVFRYGSIDGESYFLTQDVDQNRITVTIVNNVVTAAVVG